jgi:hypothetical protein
MPLFPSTQRLAAAALLFPLVVLGTSPASAADLGFYGGLTYGVAVLEAAGESTSTPVAAMGARPLQAEAERLVAVALFGGYRLAPGLAIEGARVSLSTTMPNADDPLTDPAERAAMWAVSTVGSVPLASSLALFARFGFHYAEGQPDFAQLWETDRLGRVYGVGLRFEPSPRIELRAETERFTRVGAAAAQEASAILFGARVRF